MAEEEFIYGNGTWRIDQDMDESNKTIIYGEDRKKLIVTDTFLIFDRDELKGKYLFSEDELSKVGLILNKLNINNIKLSFPSSDGKGDDDIKMFLSPNTIITWKYYIEENGMPDKYICYDPVLRSAVGGKSVKRAIKKHRSRKTIKRSKHKKRTTKHKKRTRTRARQ